MSKCNFLLIVGDKVLLKVRFERLIIDHLWIRVAEIEYSIFAQELSFNRSADNAREEIVE